MKVLEREVYIKGKKIYIQNVVFIILCLLVILGSMCVRNEKTESQMIPFPNSQILFSTKDVLLEQTWAPYAKRLNGVRVPYIAQSNFIAEMKMTVYTDEYEEVSSSVIDCVFEEGQEGEICFPFEILNVELGSRYRFVMEFCEKSENGTIRLIAGNEYSGCTVAKEEVQGAIALKFDLVKNSKIFWLVSSFVPVLSIALFLACYAERKMEETISGAFFIVGIVLLIGGLLGVLKGGVYTIYIVGVLSFLLSFVHLIKREKRISDFITPGLVVYGIVIGCFIIICQDFIRMEWDEYSHWGLAVKDMFYYDALSMHTGSSVLSKRYPPFSTLIEYYFMYANEIFSEGIMYIAYLSFLWSMLIIAFKNIKWNQVKELLLTAVIILVIPFCFVDFYYTLYVDLLLGVIFSCVLTCYFDEKPNWYNDINIVLALCALVLTKDMGLVLGCVFVMIVFGDYMVSAIKQKNIWNKKIIKVLGYGGATIAFFSVWQIYLILSNIWHQIQQGKQAQQTSTAVAASNIGFSKIIEFVTMQAEPYKYKVLKKYIKTIIYDDTYKIGNLGISYLGILLILLLATILIYKDDKEKKWILFSGTFIGSIVYATFLLITYLFTFSEYDAIVLHSHRRYLGSCIGGCVFAFLNLNMIKYRNVKDRNFEKIKLVLAFVILFTMPMNKINPQKLTPLIDKGMLQEYMDQEILLRSFADKSESVYYVYNNSSHTLLETYIYRNYCSPLVMEGGNMYGSEESIEREYQILEENEEPHMLDYYRTIITVEEWKEILQDYDYVCLHKPGYTFAESYGALFEQPETIGDRTYYKVNKDSESINLKYLGAVVY